jgi:hypothetical protein
MVEYKLNLVEESPYKEFQKETASNSASDSAFITWRKSSIYLIATKYRRPSNNDQNIPQRNLAKTSPINQLVLGFEEYIQLRALYSEARWNATAGGFNTANTFGVRLA